MHCFVEKLNNKNQSGGFPWHDKNDLKGRSLFVPSCDYSAGAINYYIAGARINVRGGRNKIFTTHRIWHVQLNRAKVLIVFLNNLRSNHSAHNDESV